jgi:hypothetical protein
MRLYLVEETITTTIKTTYEVEAENSKDALKRFRQDGKYLGDIASSGPDGVTIQEAKPEFFFRERK